ncbi:MAG: class I SAM-dependent methyltransferase [Deltaproteobacteria bacterium]|nr:class I SAM-dependent methyltransferase [Deltaproteobacteria bacterium]
MKLTEHKFKELKSIPHFYIIRSVESILLSDFIDRGTGPFLDLGCGDGSFAATLGLTEIYGIDIDEKAIKGTSENGYKKAILADATSTTFNDLFFGTVFSNCAIEHMNNIDLVLKEVCRVLKNKGRFVFTVPSKRFLDFIRQDEVLKDIGLTTEDRIAEYNLFHHHMNIFSLEEWDAVLQKAGFKLLEYEYYLPDKIGSFVARMDMLYTIDAPGSKELCRKLERAYSSLSNFKFQREVKRYLSNPHCAKSGTHLIIKAEKI